MDGSWRKYPAVNMIFLADKNTAVFKKATIIFFFSYCPPIKCHFPSILNLSYIPDLISPLKFNPWWYHWLVKAWIPGLFFNQQSFEQYLIIINDNVHRKRWSHHLCFFNALLKMLTDSDRNTVLFLVSLDVINAI